MNVEGFERGKVLKNIIMAQIIFSWTNQCTEKVDSLQHKFLVSNARDPQLLKILMGNLQQLLSIYLLPLKLVDILLQAVI